MPYRKASKTWWVGLGAGLCLGVAGLLVLFRLRGDKPKPPALAAPSARPAPATPAALVRSLRESVEAGDWHRANDLEEKLAGTGDLAVPRLGELLRDRQAPAVLRQRAAWVLGQIGTPPATRLLTGVFQNEQDPEVRGQLLLALSKITGGSGSTVRAVLEGVLRAPGETSELRSSAALLLAKRAEPAATAFLVEAVRRRDDPKVVRWAVEALAFSPHREAAAPPLRWAVQSETNEALRAAAARSLARLEGTDGLDFLEGRFRMEASAKVRLAIVNALGEMDGAAQAQGLLGLALIGDENQGVRARAAHALGRGARQESLASLESSLKGEETLYVRLKVVEAIARIGGKKAEGLLRPIAEADRFVPVRSAARAALQKLRGEGGTPLRLRPVPESAKDGPPRPF